MLPLSRSLSKWIFDPFHHLRLDLTFRFYMREISTIPFIVRTCGRLVKCCFLHLRPMRFLRKSAQERLLDRANIYIPASGHCEGRGALSDPFKSGHVNKYLLLRVSLRLSGHVCKKFYLFAFLKGNQASAFKREKFYMQTPQSRKNRTEKK